MNEETKPAADGRALSEGLGARVACALLLVAALAGCGKAKEAMEASTIADQCLRVELFHRCLAALPAGPQAAKYNDWDEVVSECGSQAFYQSLRRREFVKPECRAD